MINYSGSENYFIKPCKKRNLDLYNKFIEDYLIESYLAKEINLGFGDFYIEQFVNEKDPLYKRVSNYMKFKRLKNKYKEKVFLLEKESFSQKEKVLEQKILLTLSFQKKEKHIIEFCREILSYDELERAAEAQGNCLLSYSKSIKNANSSIFEINYNNEITHVQINNEDKSVVQHCGYRNKKPGASHKQIVKELIQNL